MDIEKELHDLGTYHEERATFYAAKSQKANMEYDSDAEIGYKAISIFHKRYCTLLTKVYHMLVEQRKDILAEDDNS